MNATATEHRDVEYVRALARSGTLAATFSAASSTQQRRLTGAVMTVATPVVYTRLTRIVELKRGHTGCAVAMNRLSAACLDGFYDDLEAVTLDTLRNATTCINSLEGWLAGRIRAITVDAHRRRRGARGAQQRPRLPTWLARVLGHDPWLGHLAVEILTWVGVPATAGSSLWPLDSWNEQRAMFTGAAAGDGTRSVERDVEQVLAAMRTRRDWYENYIERPLGAKTPPVAALGPEFAATDELRALALVEPHEVLDARLTELAGLALEAIEHLVTTGADLTAAVADVVGRVFGGPDLARELEDLPHSASTADERVPALVSDAAQLAELVVAVRDILGGSAAG